MNSAPSFETLAEGLPFRDAIEYFRRKLNLPTLTWTDVWQEMNARSFVVAGTMQAELIQGFREAVEKGIADGTTLAEFRKDFDRIVQKHGWAYKGGRAWRTSVIFNTNLRVAYQAGHYRQMMDPDVLAARPYWRYSAVMDGRTRPMHAAWNNLVLPYDDPWWKSHYPPNGWGCRCTVVNHSGREVDRLRDRGVKLVEEAPEIRMIDHQVRQSDGTIKTVSVPEGIDPGWAYNVGEFAWAEGL
ncbi:MAG: phage minor head protein [Syntrophobacteraceae bacterium]